MGFCRQEYWSGLPFPSPGDIPNPGIEPKSPVLEADALTSEPPGKPLPWWLRRKSVSLQCRRPGFNSWVRKIPWRRKWQPTLVFLLGESHGQRSLAGYSLWGCKSWTRLSVSKHTAPQVKGFPHSSVGKECLQCRSPGFESCVRKIPWRRKWQPTPVFMPG